MSEIRSRMIHELMLLKPEDEIAREILSRILRFKPLTELTGEDSEWIELSDGTFQNRRCETVFKDLDGRAYEMNAKIFTDNGGETWYTTTDSRVEIRFPHYPPTYPQRVFVRNGE